MKLKNTATLVTGGAHGMRRYRRRLIGSAIPDSAIPDTHDFSQGHSLMHH